ncbi:MAG: hypothetical protein WCI52_02550 [bacterium]
MPEENIGTEEKKTASTAALTPEEQIALLHRKLAGHQAFGRCRGEFSDLSMDEFLKQPNPTAALAAFEAAVADRRIMLNMLACLRRDGHLVAEEQLTKALDSEHVIVGETVPLEETEHGVLLIFDPEKVFLLTRWMYTSNREDGQYWVQNGCPDPNREPCGALTGKLLETFPELQKIFQKEHISHCQSPTYVVYPRIKDVSNRLEAYKNDRFFIWVDPDRTSLWYFANAVGVFIAGKEQDEIFREAKFTREEQESIAVWKFDYPACARHHFSNAFSSSPDMWIGFHPESEHDTWKKQWPSFTSKNFSQGMGAIILDKEMIGQWGWGNKSPFTTYQSLRGVYPGSYEESDRFILGFPYNR